MSFGEALGLAVSVLVLIYLMYAIFRGERL
jgi:K+-transporting ATPase KdpF subunit